MTKQAGEILREFRIKRVWTQLEFARLIGLDVYDGSVISKIENGERLLSPYYIKLIENTNVFTTEEDFRLKEQAAIDSIRKEFGIDMSERLNAQLDSLEEQLKDINQLRRRGFTDTINLLHNPIAQLRKSRDQPSGDGAKAKRLLAKFLKERLETRAETASMSGIVRSTRADLYELRGLLPILKEYDLEDYEYVISAPATFLFTAGFNDDAIQMTKGFLGKLTTSYAIAKSFHTLLLAPAVLVSEGDSIKNRTEEFLEFEERAYKEIAEKNVNKNGRSMLLEAISGARVHLRLSDWQEVWDEAAQLQKSTMRQGVGRATIMGSLYRTQILNLLREGERNSEFIIEKCERALRDFNKSNFQTYQDQILNELSKSKNPRLRRYEEHLRNLR